MSDKPRTMLEIIENLGVLKAAFKAAPKGSKERKAAEKAWKQETEAFGEAMKCAEDDKGWWQWHR